MKKIIAFFTLTAVLLALCGCEREEDTPLPKTPIASVMLLSNRNNSGYPNFAILEEEIEKTILSGGNLIIIQLDGKPEIVFAKSFSKMRENAEINRTKFDNDVFKTASEIVRSLPSLTKANDPEIDILEGIRLGIKAAARYDSYDRRMIIMDSGLATKGNVNYNNNLLAAEVNTIIDDLTERMEIPDVSQFNAISWYYLGETKPPQEALSQKQLYKLKDIWYAILACSGVNPIFEGGIVDTCTEQTGLPEVSVIRLDIDPPRKYISAKDTISTVDQTPSVSIPSNEETPIIYNDMFEKPYALTEETLRFVENSDEYVLSDAEVRDLLEPIANYLQSDVSGAKNLLLVGTTAGDTVSETSIELSERRAAKIKETLCSMGCDSSRIISVGMACTDPWHIKGGGTSGAIASANRKVVILDVDSEVAQTILKSSRLS